jgi:hypothetical protein
MTRLLAPELPPGCPWSGWTPPNVNWCEEELCQLIVNPAGTWSNLAYLVFGLWMWRLARATGRSELRLFAPASIIAGLFSGIYHASYTYFFQVFDFVGMFVFCFVVLTINARRLGWIEERHQWPFYLAGVAGMTLLVLVLFEFGVPIQGLVLILILVSIGQEIVLRGRASRSNEAHYGVYLAALALLTTAAVFSLVDVTRAWCDPTNHWLQGHALWHLFSASALMVLYHFYSRLPPLDTGRD